MNTKYQKSHLGGTITPQKKSFFSSLARSFAKGVTFSLGLLITGIIIVYAISFPSTTPSGEVPGGKFRAELDKIWGAVQITGTDITITGSISAINAPTTANNLATKAYVDAQVSAGGGGGSGLGRPKRIFITSTTYDGNLGGVAGADAKCQARANAGSLGGTWKATVSIGGTSLQDRINDNWDYLVDLKGHFIADYWALFSGVGYDTNTYNGTYQTESVNQRLGVRYNELGIKQYSPGQWGAHGCDDWTNNTLINMWTNPNTGWYTRLEFAGGFRGSNGSYGSYQTYNISCTTLLALACIEQ